MIKEYVNKIEQEQQLIRVIRGPWSLLAVPYISSYLCGETRLIPQPSNRLIAPLSRCVLVPKGQMNDWSPAKMSSFLPAFTVAQLRASEVSQVVKMVWTWSLSWFFFRDLSELKAEQLRLSGSILVSCSRLNSGVRLRESVSLGRPVLKDQAQQEAEEEISQKTWEAMHLQVKGDLEKKELQER